MTTSIATVTTDRASTYLQQLCKHFGHKVPVTFTPETGEITLPFGSSALRAEDGVLTLSVTGDDTDLAKLEQFIGSHFARFAFRENLSLTWARNA